MKVFHEASWVEWLKAWNTVNSDALLLPLFGTEKLIVLVTVSVTCLLLTVESLSRNYFGQRELLHSRLCHLAVVSPHPISSGRCVGVKSQHHCLNFRHTWKAIPASALSCEFSWRLCWKWITVQLLPLFKFPSFSITNSFIQFICCNYCSWKPIPTNFLHTNLCLNFYLPWGTEIMRLNG